jgi:hypothetical protein
MYTSTLRSWTGSFRTRAIFHHTKYMICVIFLTELAK